MVTGEINAFRHIKYIILILLLLEESDLFDDSHDIFGTDAVCFTGENSFSSIELKSVKNAAKN